MTTDDDQFLIDDLNEMDILALISVEPKHDSLLNQMNPANLWHRNDTSDNGFDLLDRFDPQDAPKQPPSGQWNQVVESIIPNASSTSIGPKSRTNLSDSYQASSNFQNDGKHDALAYSGGEYRNPNLSDATEETQDIRQLLNDDSQNLIQDLIDLNKIPNEIITPGPSRRADQPLEILSSRGSTRAQPITNSSWMIPSGLPSSGRKRSLSDVDLVPPSRKRGRRPTTGANSGKYTQREEEIDGKIVTTSCFGNKRVEKGSLEYIKKRESNNESVRRHRKNKEQNYDTRIKELEEKLKKIQQECKENEEEKQVFKKLYFDLLKKVNESPINRH